MDYATLDKMEALARDERTDQATRAVATAYLAKARTALVVTSNGKSLTWRDRAKARTETIIMEEGARRHGIGLEVERNTANHSEAMQQIRQRMAKATITHETDMATAQDVLEEAKLKLEEQRVRRAKRRQEMGC
jgi:hypothetical protein